MTTARFIEYRITRDLVHRRHASPVVDHGQRAGSG